MKIALLFLVVLVSCGHKDKKIVKGPEIEGLEQLQMAPLDGRPAMLIVGDSISIGYYPTVISNFSDYQVIHNTGNARTTRVGIENIQTWTDHAPEWEMCTINHGLHDMNTDYAITNDEYSRNLQIEIDTMKTRCKRIIFITTTHVPKHAIKRSNARAIELNQAATDLMTSNGIGVCDIYPLSYQIQPLHKNAALKDNVHYVPEGYRQLGLAVAECIQNEL